jgi:SAM-dependent methyltransferase
MEKLDIGIGPKPQGDINIDVVPNPHADLLADIQYLPFRDEVWLRVQALAVLEHVDKPFLAMSEIRRIMRKDAEAVLGVPKPFWTNNSFYYLMFFIINLPVTLHPQRLRSLRKKIQQINSRDVALYHKFRVSENEISRLFLIVEKIEYGDILYPFLSYGRKGHKFRHKKRLNTAIKFRCKK